MFEKDTNIKNERYNNSRKITASIFDNCDDYTEEAEVFPFGCSDDPSSSLDSDDIVFNSQINCMELFTSERINNGSY